MDKKITVSIVVYKPNIEVFARTLNSALNSPLVSMVYVFDNSPHESVRSICSDSRVNYIANKKNIGFGAAHNIAIKYAKTLDPRYHLVLNPDIYFEKGTIEKIYDFMEINGNVGLLMPKVLYPDGSTQYLCKLLPSPLQLILRRFLPFKSILDKMNETYELRFTGYDKIIDVPYLSGCFMFLRTKVLEKVGLFDERFFMYFEDLDITRRINLCNRTVFYPEPVIYHNYKKGSYKSLKLLMYHLLFALKYFNKWGYFFDKSRRQINEKTLNQLS